MVRPTELAQVFEDRQLQSITLRDSGTILLEFRGCFCADVDAVFAGMGACYLDEITDGVEIWILTPSDTQRAAVVSIIVSAWRFHCAPKVAPWMSFSNFDTAWGSTVSSFEQKATACALFTVGHKVRLYHDQAEARKSCYSVIADTEADHIAVQVDTKVFLVSPRGYLYTTSIADCPTD